MLTASQWISCRQPKLGFVFFAKSGVLIWLTNAKGKSTLVNRMIDEAGPQEGRTAPRSLTSPIAGTTHDTVDTPLKWHGAKELVLLDTAGIDRRSKTQRAGLDRSTVLWAMKTISSADVNLLTIDAEKGVTANEKRIAGTILDSKSSVVVVVNKSDLLASGRSVKQDYEKEVRRQLQFLSWVPVVFVCARDGTNVPGLVNKGANARVMTAALVSCLTLVILGFVISDYHLRGAAEAHPNAPPVGVGAACAIAATTTIQGASASQSRAPVWKVLCG